MTITLELPSGTYILIKRGFTDSQFQVNHQDLLGHNFQTLTYKTETQGIKWCDLPNGDWQLIATVKEITEQQAKKIVERVSNRFIFGSAFENYLDDESFFETALASFHSWLKANNIYSENPYGEKMPEPIHKRTINGQLYLENEKEISRWFTIQERTGNFVILKQLK